MKKEIKLPTILGLIILVIGVAAGVFLVQSGQVFRLRAKPSETPQQVRISNIKDASFSVSWLTDDATVGFLSYGKSASLGATAKDDASSGQPAFVHHITVGGLSPNTTYFFKVGADKNLFDNDGKPYQATTAPALRTAPATDVIFGTVEDASGLPAAGAVVYATISGVSPLSALTDAQGKWTIPLSQARSATLSSYAQYSPTDKAQLFVQTGDQFASATIPVGAAKPVPPITLGQTHDFSELQPKKSGELPSSEITLPEETPAGSPESGFKFEEGETAGSSQISLKSPDDGESVSTSKPQFVGTGTPGTTFTITVESETYTDELTVDKDGDWNWSPPANLSSGEHAVTLSWKDESGQTRVLKRTFTVLAAGTSDLPSFTASPSGSTATPSPSPSPTSTSSGITAIPSTEGGVPISGNLTTTLGLFIMGVVLVLAGIFLPRVLKA